ncbi:MAG: pilus assembly protein PilM [Spirochaetes bacterium]|nr:pilus assembly protein PilM [Spirochaetota bacterium]
MFEKLLAIDIGSSSIKAISAKRGLKKTDIIHFSSRMIDPSAENQQQELFDSLEDLMTEFTDTDYTLITNIPLKSVILRNFAFPFSDPAKIAEVLPLEAEETLPFEIEETDLSFQLSHQSEEEGKIIAAAVLKDHMSRFLEPLEKTGLKPQYTGIESNSLFESLHPNSIEAHSFIQIDIGHSKTVVNLIHESNLISTRMIQAACSTVISEIADILKIDYNEAYGKFENLHLDLSDTDNNFNSNFYKSLKITKKQMQQIFQAGTDIFTDICDQIQMTIQSIKADSPIVEFERIYLTGGGALLPRISDVFSSALELPVNALPATNDFPNQIVQTKFSNCYGLIELYKNRSDYIDFCAEKSSSPFGSIDIVKLYPALFFSSLSIIVLCIVLVLNFVFSTYEHAATRDVLEKQFSTLFKVKPTDQNPLSSARQITQKETEKINLVKNLIPEENSMIKLISAVATQLPEESDLELKSLTISDKGINLSGTVEESSTLSDFLTKLKAVPIFDTVTDRTTSTGSISRFSVEIKLKGKSK